MLYQELVKLPKDHPFVLAYRWLRLESWALAAAGLAVGISMAFEGPQNFEAPLWRGVTTLLPIQAWGLLFLSVGVVMVVQLVRQRLPLWATIVGATGGSALGTLLLLGGQHPASSMVPGLFCAFLVAWAALIVAKNLSMREDMKALAQRETRLSRQAEQDEQARRRAEQVPDGLV